MTRKEKFIEVYKKTGFNQAQFADTVGLSRSFCGLLIRGLSSVSDSLAETVKKVYGVDLDKAEKDFEIRQVDIWSERRKEQEMKDKKVRDNFVKLFKSSRMKVTHFDDKLGVSCTSRILHGGKVTPGVVQKVKKVFSVDLTQDLEIEAPERTQEELLAMIKEVIKATHLSHKRFADSLDCHESLISYILSGKRLVTQDVIARIKKAHNVDILTDSIEDVLDKVKSKRYIAKLFDGTEKKISSLDELIGLNYVKIERV